jgi:4-amino-4-deoxy-L-arabinose transferase-like glycosyltransferase
MRTTLKQKSGQELNLTTEESTRESQLNLNQVLKRESVLLVSLVLMAFAIRLWMAKFNTIIEGDGLWYATLGKNLISGNIRDGLSTYWPPLYPLLVGVSSLIFHDLEFAGRFVSVLSGSLLVIPVYYLSRKLYGRQVAVISGLLVATSAMLITYSTSMMSESTYLLVLTTAIAVGLFALLQSGRGLFFLTGLAFGACFLVRPEAAAYILLMILLALGGRIYNERVSRHRIILNCILVFVGFLLLSAPYVLYIHDQTGKWTISGKVAGNLAGDTLRWRRITPDGQSTRADIQWAGSHLGSLAVVQSEAIPANTQSVSVGIIHRFIKSVIPTATALSAVVKKSVEVVLPLFSLLACLGLFTFAWSKTQAALQIYIMLFVFATIVGYSFTVLQNRYLLPLAPLFICWSANGIIVFENWLAGTLDNLHKPTALLVRKTMLGRILILALLLISMAPLLTQFAKRGDNNPKSVAAWIKEHSSQPPVILASSPWAAFWADGKHYYLPDEEYPVVIDYARRKGAKYLLIEEAQISKTPQLRFLLEGPDTPELRLVNRYEPGGKPKVLVYELINPPTSQN